MPIKIDYTGDPREFLEATGKTTEALDATTAKLEEVGDEGAKSGQAAADGLDAVRGRQLVDEGLAHVVIVVDDEDAGRLAHDGSLTGISSSCSVNVDSTRALWLNV